MKRFALGFFYLVVFAVFSPHYQDSYLTSDDFGVSLCPKLNLTSIFDVFLSQLPIFITLFFFPQAQPFWYRCVYILIWGKISLYKYVSCWVIAVSFPFGLQKHAWKLDCCDHSQKKGKNPRPRLLTLALRESELKKKKITK